MVTKTKAFELFEDLPQTPRRWMSRARMVVGPSTKAIVLGRNDCSEAVGTDPIEIFLHRRGAERSTTSTPCAKLTAFDKDMEGRVRFMLDDAFARLPMGRYAAQVMQGCTVCFIFEIAIERKCTVSVSSMDAVSGEDMVVHNGSLPNMTAIFDSLNTFTAKTCRILEPGATQLPLSNADLARLCAVTLCRPVELLIGDGVKTETVSFAGCAGGVATVTRGVAGSSPSRFPVGAKVSFSWTAANVVAASEGCV